jgi:hypothetical protein
MRLVTHPTWITNANPSWSHKLASFQASLYQHQHGLAVETPNWVALRCTPANGHGHPRLLGGFGLHFHKANRHMPVHHGGGPAHSLSGSYDTRHVGHKGVSVVHLPHGLPAPSRVRVSVHLTPHGHLVSGKLSMELTWRPPSGSPYKRCEGVFTLKPR